MNVVAVFIGGGLGSLARYGLNRLCSHFISTIFPLATLGVNVLSCLILGLFAGMNAARNDQDAWRLLIAVGFCGGFSTFSSFSMETFTLIREGNLGFALLSVLLNLTLCMGGLAAGVYITKSV